MAPRFCVAADLAVSDATQQWWNQSETSGIGWRADMDEPSGVEFSPITLPGVRLQSLMTLLLKVMIINICGEDGLFTGDWSSKPAKFGTGRQVWAAFGLNRWFKGCFRGWALILKARFVFTPLILLLWLIAPQSLLASTGEIVGLSVSNGWMYVTLDGMGIGGAYRLGIAGAVGLNLPTNPTVVLNYKSPGFDTLGNSVQILRTNFATSPVRRNYPNMGLNEEVAVDGRLTLHLALMNHTYMKDSEVVASMAAGMYSVLGVGSQAVVGVRVQNDSTQNYRKPVANWSRPPLDILNKTNAMLAITGFAHHAENGRPLQCVQFWAIDRFGMSTPVPHLPRSMTWIFSGWEKGR